MPEKMEPASDENPQPVKKVDVNDLIDKDELAEKVFALLKREIEIESERTGKLYKGR